MENNQGYIICINTNELGECYLGRRDGVYSKIRSAEIFNDEMQAKSVLGEVIKLYGKDNNSFFNDPDKLSIKKVEINIFDVVDLTDSYIIGNINKK